MQKPFPSSFSDLIHVLIFLSLVVGQGALAAVFSNSGKEGETIASEFVPTLAELNLSPRQWASLNSTPVQQDFGDEVRKDVQRWLENYDPVKEALLLKEISFRAMRMTLDQVCDANWSRGFGSEKNRIRDYQQVKAVFLKDQAIAPKTVALQADSIQTQQSKPSSEVSPAIEGTVAPLVDIQFEEAFQEGIPLPQAHSQSVSEESLDPNFRRGWELGLGSQEHWPTLGWVDTVFERHPILPLVSSNSVRGLEYLSGSTQKAERGIVFGKIAQNWVLDFSAQENKPTLLTLDRLPIDDYHKAPGEKYFVYLNVEPGAHVLRFRPLSGGPGGAIAVPVLSGTSTFLDVTRIRFNRMKGNVTWNREVFHGEGQLDNAVVRVVGQKQAMTVSHRDGKFQLDRVVTVGTYPLFVETDRGTGFTHRYRVIPSQLSNVRLPRLVPAEIEKWIAQLEGGVHADSAMVVSMVGDLVEKNHQEILIPGIRAIPANARLIPETYTVSARGHLLPRAPLNLYETRYVGIQIPEGLGLSMVESDKGEVLWSELFMSSPGVVNVVGPLRVQ